MRAAYLAVELHLEPAASNDLAQRLALLGNHDLVALLGKGDLHGTLWDFLGLGLALRELALPPRQIGVTGLRRRTQEITKGEDGRARQHV